MTAARLFRWMDRAADFLGSLLFATIFGIAVVVCWICDRANQFYRFVQRVDDPLLSIGLFLAFILFFCMSAFLLIPYAASR